MKQKYEIILAGTGGQGLVTSGIMLAQAAIFDGKNAVQTQTYGIAQRGGFSSAEVIVDKEEILFQKVEQPDIIIALSDFVVDRYKNISAPVLYDSSLMKEIKADSWYGLPFYQIAMSLGSVKTANLVAIGAMLEKVPMVSVDSIIKVIRNKFSADVAEMNIKAVYRGIDAAKSFSKKG